MIKPECGVARSCKLYTHETTTISCMFIGRCELHVSVYQLLFIGVERLEKTNDVSKDSENGVV